jgi:hypothetical protein
MNKLKTSLLYEGQQTSSIRRSLGLQSIWGWEQWAQSNHRLPRRPILPASWHLEIC